MPKTNPFRSSKTLPEIIQLAVLLFIQLSLSRRNVGNLRKERQVERLHSCRWPQHRDEMFGKINGERHFPWRALYHEADALKRFVPKTGDSKAALKELCAGARQETGRLVNNRADKPHLPFRRRKRPMLTLRCMRRRHGFTPAHASVSNHFNQGRSRASCPIFKANGAAALTEWRRLCAE